ncbi:MAG: ABC transporter ATP-binding protein [Anaerolineae bacterium]
MANERQDSTLLEVEGVHAGYGKFEVLKGVSLRVNQGEIVSIIGPNGAGKSTLLKTVFGFLKPVQGRVMFEGQDITGWPPPKVLRQNMAYVMQDYSVFPDMTVEDNLRLGAYIRDDAGVEVDIQQVLELFPVLHERRRQKARHLSGGERRMLEIARSLLLKPKLLLLDEPTLGLAPRMIELIYAKIRELNAQGVTLLIVEQNAKTALNHSNRAYVLEDGRNRFEGTGEGILAHPEVRRAYLGG